MEHPHSKEEKNYDFLYYVIGLVFGMMVGIIIEKSLIWVPIGGVLGLFTAAFFVKAIVKSGGDA